MADCWKRFVIYQKSLQPSTLDYLQPQTTNWSQLRAGMSAGKNSVLTVDDIVSRSINNSIVVNHNSWKGEQKKGRNLGCRSKRKNFSSRVASIIPHQFKRAAWAKSWITRLFALTISHVLRHTFETPDRQLIVERIELPFELRNFLSAWQWKFLKRFSSDDASPLSETMCFFPVDRKTLLCSVWSCSLLNTDITYLRFN